VVALISMISLRIDFSKMPILVHFEAGTLLVVLIVLEICN